MKLKRLAAFLLALSLVFGLLPNTMVTSAAKKPSLNKTQITLKVGSSTKLKMKNTKAKVVWKSSNKKVAKVSKKGKVTAVKKGTAKITARVSGKKYTCKVTVVKKTSKNSSSANANNTDTATASDNQSANANTNATTPSGNQNANTNATTPSGNQNANTNATTPSGNQNANANDTSATTPSGNQNANESTTASSDATTEATTEARAISLSDLKFEDGYSTLKFHVNVSIPVSVLAGNNGMESVDTSEEEDEDDDTSATVTLVNSSGEEYTCSFDYSEQEQSTNSETEHNYTLSGSFYSLPLGDYDVLCNGMYFTSISTDDFKNLRRQGKRNYADVTTSKLTIVSASGTLTLANNSGIASNELKVLVKQTVNGKEYTSYSSVASDGTYSVDLVDGYQYDILPAGVSAGKQTVKVTGGKIEGSLNLELSTQLKKVIFTDEENKFDEDDDVLSLRTDSDIVEIRYDDSQGYYAFVPTGTYNLFREEYKIGKDIVIDENTTSIKLVMPVFTVTVTLNGKVVNLSEYGYSVEYATVDNDSDSFAVSAGTYRLLDRQRNVIGEYEVSIDTADEYCNVVWEIPMAQVSLKNFDTSLNIGDYIVKDSKGNICESQAGASSIRLPRGEYSLYETIAGAEDSDDDEDDSETVGERLGDFSVTLGQAQKGAKVVWNLELATVSGTVQVPANTSAYSESSVWTIDIYKYKKGASHLSSENFVKSISIDDVAVVGRDMDIYSFSWGYYSGNYSVKLPKGDYVFQVRAEGGYNRVVTSATVAVQQETVERNIEGVNAKIYLSTSKDGAGDGLVLRIPSVSGCVLYNQGDGTYSTSFLLDRESTYELYLEDSLDNRQLLTDSYCYGDTNPIDIDSVVSVASYTLPLTQDYGFVNLSTSTVEQVKNGTVDVSDGNYGSVNEVNGEYKVALFEKEGTYTVSYGNSSSNQTALGALTLKDGEFTYTPID